MSKQDILIIILGFLTGVFMPTPHTLGQVFCCFAVVICSAGAGFIIGKTINNE